MIRYKQVVNLLKAIGDGKIGPRSKHKFKGLGIESITVNYEGGYKISYEVIKSIKGIKVKVHSVDTKSNNHWILGMIKPIKNPWRELTLEQRRRIKKFWREKDDRNKISVECRWYVVKNNCKVGPMYDKGVTLKGKSFPKIMYRNEFWSEEEAKEAAKQFKEYDEAIQEKEKQKWAKKKKKRLTKKSS